MKIWPAFVLGCHLVACATGAGVDQGSQPDGSGTAGGADGGMPGDRPGSGGAPGTGAMGTGAMGTGGVGTGGSLGTGGTPSGTGGAASGTGGAGMGGRGTGGAGAGTGGRGTGGAGSGGAGTGGAPTGVCDPLTNAGCAAGMKCTALQNGTAITLGCGTKGTKTEGASCMPILNGTTQTGDDCTDGMACFTLQGETTALCRQFCQMGGAGGAAPACPSPKTCTLQISSLPDQSFCRVTTSCLPLAQSGCPTGQACYVATAGAICATAGTKKPGDPCAAANDCARGSTCLTTNGVSTCASFCSMAAGGTPACAATGTGGATCSALPGTPPEPNVGACR